jgi:CRP-like cAMP-binding protein
LLLRALSEAKLEALGQRLELVELVEKTILVEAGRPRTHIYLPHSGAISIMVRLSEGQTVEVATIARDSVFGAAAALDGGQSLTSAFVVLPCPASVLDAADFRASVHRSVTFRATVARDEQALLAMAQQSAACNASRPVEARLSRRRCVHAIYTAAKGCRLLRKPRHN